MGLYSAIVVALCIVYRYIQLCTVGFSFDAMCVYYTLYPPTHPHTHTHTLHTHTHTQLVESYGQNKKTSLLHFLVQQIHSKQPELLDMPVNMEAVAKSSDSQ